MGEAVQPLFKHRKVMWTKGLKSLPREVLVREMGGSWVKSFWDFLLFCRWQIIYLYINKKTQMGREFH